MRLSIKVQRFGPWKCDYRLGNVTIILEQHSCIKPHPFMQLSNRHSLGMVSKAVHLANHNIIIIIIIIIHTPLKVKT